MKKLFWSLITAASIAAAVVTFFRPDLLVMGAALPVQPVTPTAASITPDVTATPDTTTSVSTPAPVETTPVAPVTATPPAPTYPIVDNGNGTVSIPSTPDNSICQFPYYQTNPGPYGPTTCALTAGYTDCHNDTAVPDGQQCTNTITPYQP